MIRDRLVNPLVRSILRSPLHPVLSGALILLSYRGRRTGRERTIPVMYAQDGDRLLVLVGGASGKQWWRNLRGGAPIDVRLRGRRRTGQATVLAGSAAELEPSLRAYLTRFPRAARATQHDEPIVMVRVDLDPQGAHPPAGAPGPRR